MRTIESLIGQFIKEKRESSSHFKNQELLANSVGITRATLAKIESGETSTFFGTIFKILESLNSNFTEFEEFIESQTIENQAQRMVKNKTDLDIILGNFKELQ